MTRAYELMVIIDRDVEDPKAQSWIKTITDGIVAAGGSIHGKPDWWGKRQFAYPIHKKESGYYLVIECIAPPVLKRQSAPPFLNSVFSRFSRDQWSFCAAIRVNSCLL